MANSRCESYKFSNLDDLSKAVKEAFGTADNEACHVKKDYVLDFYPTGSYAFDTAAHTAIKKYHGRLLDESYKFPRLSAMSEAIQEAFGSHKHEACDIKKESILVFHPTGSADFDNNVRTIIAQHDGQRLE